MIKKLREDPWGVHAKIIVLTNLEDRSNVVVKSGFTGLGDVYEYLMKSNWFLEDVVAKVKEKLKINS